MLRGLDHIIIAVRDLENGSSRMAQILGRAPSWTGVHPDGGTGNRLFRLDNMYVELMGVCGAGWLADALNAHLESKGESVWGISFATDDAEACRKFFESRDIAPVVVQEGSGRNEITGAERHWRLVLPSREATRGLFLFAIEHQSDENLLPPTSSDDEVSSVRGLDHLVIRTSSPDGMNDLLGASGMGIRLALDQTVPQWGGRQMFFRLAGATLEVVSGKEKTADHIWGLAWRVGDVAAAHARLAAAGFDISPVRKGRKSGTLVFTLRDPLPEGAAQIPTLMIGPEAG